MRCEPHNHEAKLRADLRPRKCRAMNVENL